MAYREHVVTDEAVVAARHAGIVTNVRRRVAEMAYRSAPFRHPEGNRRFRKFVLRIEGRAVTNVARVDPAPNLCN